MTTKKEIKVNPVNGKLICPECGVDYDWMSIHLKKAHGVKREGIEELYTGPIVSESAKKKMGARSQCQGGGYKRTKVVATNPAPAPEDAQPESDDTLSFGKVSLKMRPLDASNLFIPRHDEKYQPDDRLFEYVALGVQQNTPVLLVGPTGCGKSSAVQEMAAILNQPLRRVSLNGDFAAADFLGEKTIQVDPESGQSVVDWQDGVLPQAMREGHWLLVDEIDSAHPSVLFALQVVLEGAALTLAGNGGEVVEPHPDFRFFATANTIGVGDDTGLYTGTKILNEATLDRFGIVHRVGYLPEAEEVKVVMDKSGMTDRALARGLVKVAHEVRNGFEMKAVFCTFSTRRLINLAKAIVKLGDIKRGFQVAVLARLRPEDAEYVKGIGQRVLGSVIA
jgi:cobaltochelatase CobS